MPTIPALRAAINNVHQKGVAVQNEIKRLAAIEQQLVGQNKKNRSLLSRALVALAPKLKPVTMYDTTTPDRALPTPFPEAVAGYIGGIFNDFAALKQKYPHAIHLSIAVNASESAEVLDVETGDAVPNEAPAWIRRMRSQGITRPWIYANASTMPAVESVLHRSGILRSWYRLWVAHYDNIAEVPPGFDAKQYRSVESGGYNYDVSIVAPGVFH